MKKYLKKILVISIILVMCMSIISINGRVNGVTHASGEPPEPFTTVEETEFGSISTYDLTEFVNDCVYVRLDFKSEYVSSIGGNYAGIQLSLTSTGNISGATLELSEKSENWKMTERRSIFNTQPTNNITNKILLEIDKDANLSDGSESVYFVFRYMNCTVSTGNTETFEVNNAIVSSASGQTVKYNGEENKTVTATVKSATLNSTSENVYISQNLNSIWVKSNESQEGNMKTYQDLIKSFQFNDTSADVEWYFKKDTAITEWKKVSEYVTEKLTTGMITFSRKNEDARARNEKHLFVIADCRTGDSEDTALGVNISDVMLQRRYVVGHSSYDGVAPQGGFELACVRAELPTGGMLASGSLNNVRGKIKEELNVGDIIKTRKRIINKKWD